MDRKKTHGLGLFLIVTVKMIASGEHESVETIEAKIAEGVSSYLVSHYKEYFESIYFDYDNCESIDEYYKNEWSGCADAKEEKYNCGTNDGLVLIVNLALDDAFC